MDLTIPLVLFSGILAGISPCALAVYPIVLNMLSRDDRDRKMLVILFCVGMATTVSLFYIVLGIATSFWGGETAGEIDGLRALLYVPTGLYLAAYSLTGKTGVNFGRYVSLPKKIGTGPLLAYLRGAYFSLLAMSCTFPLVVTGLVPALAKHETYLQGFFYIIVFSIAMTSPILMLGIIQTHAQEKIGLLRKNMRGIEVVSRGLIFIAAIYFLWTGIELI
ncbi:cytochrome c biogenesis CcdA family protein [Candidatus Altiarchaeota archaeon]